MKKNLKIEKIDEAIEPEKVLNSFSNWFDANKTLAFFATLIIGIITHLTMLTGIIMSQDGIWNSMHYFRPGTWEISLGRWGLELIGRFNNFIAIPTVASISCLICMAIGAVLIVDLFDIKNKFGIIITAAAIVVSPSLVVTLLYVYTSFAYCFCFMVSAAVVWLIYKYKAHPKLGLLLATVLFTLSLSIYQSYIGVTIALCIMKSVLDLLSNTKTIKEVLINMLKTICVVIVGGILYFIVSILMINLLSIGEFGYKAKDVSLLGIICGIPHGLIQSYKDFLAYFLRDRIVSNSNYRREVFFIVLFITTGIATLIRLIECKSEDKKNVLLRRILAILFIALIPVGLNIVNLLVVGNELYALSAYQMILILPFAVAILEGQKNLNIVKWIFILSILVVIFTYYIADNTSYAALELTYNQAYSTTLRILDRIENTAGYEEGMPIVIVGIIGDNNYPRTNNLYNYTIGSVVNNPVFHYSYSGMIGTWQNYFRIFFGIEVKLATEQEYTKIIDSQYFREEAEVFPSQKSVYIQDGFVVVKLDENPPVAF